MNMRMVRQVSCVRMQYRDNTWGAFELFVITTKGLQGVPDSIEQQSVTSSLMMEEQGAQLCGNGKSYHKIVSWHLFPALILQPLL